MIDYSQSGEQAAILDAVAAVTGRVPRFLDIGAGDGISYSNTRALVEAGWHGVCVEPAAWAFSRLAELYKYRVAIKVCQAVITGSECGPIMLHYSDGDHLSTTVEGEARKWPDVPFIQMTVAAISVPQLLDWYGGGFTVVSVDAEGRTNEIVEAYRLHPAWDEVRVFCIEHEGDRPEIPGWEKVAVTANNTVYAR